MKKSFLFVGVSFLNLSLVFANGICQDIQNPAQGSVELRDLDDTHVVVDVKNSKAKEELNGEYVCLVNNPHKDGQKLTARLNCSKGAKVIFAYVTDTQESNGQITTSVDFFDLNGQTFFKSNCVRN